MLGLNTVRGKPGENGLAALSGREAEALAAIDQALAYAASIEAGMFMLWPVSPVAQTLALCLSRTSPMPVNGGVKVGHWAAQK
jgi:hydroxypyruvate isomerase